MYMCEICGLRTSKDTWCPNHPYEPLLKLEQCECGLYHGPHDNNKCPKCGACHFKYGEYILDDMYPMSKCTKCGEVHIWD